MKSLKNIWEVIRGSITLGLFGLFIYEVINFIVREITVAIDRLTIVASNTDAVIIVALITGTLSVLGVVISSVVGKIVEYRQNVKRYLFEKREQPYSEFINLVYKIMEKSQKGEELNEAEMLADMMSFSKLLSLWGSNRVIKKWLKFRLSAQKADYNPKQNLIVMEDIIFEIRKDMGQKRYGLKKGDLLSFFINDIQNLFK